MSYLDAQKAAEIIRDAEGRIVGRTRLQKVGYLLYVAGLEDRFHYTYRHFGPYSEELANGVRDASVLRLVYETEQQATWGGTYSIYTANQISAGTPPDSRRQLATEAASADAVELELAATAIYLSKEGCGDPWGETARRKPEKAEAGRLDKAKALYLRLTDIRTPSPWPKL